MKIHEKKTVADYVSLWGNSASLALLDSACKIFSVPGIEGIIGYRFTLKSAIVFGDPVCNPQGTQHLVKEFHSFCTKQKKSIVYISISQQFAHQILNLGCKATIGFGDEIILNPIIDPKSGTGRKASMLRNKCNQSLKEGITVHEYTAYNTETEYEIEHVATEWINARKGAQIYLWQINLFDHREHKRWFYARYKGNIVGVIMLNRLNTRNGWALNIMMISPKAPNTTSEFLVLSTLDFLRKENCPHLTIGTTPASELGEITGIGKYSSWFARNIYSVAKKIFKLGDRQRYWKKFNPHTEPLYLAFTHSKIRASDILAVMRALNVGSSSQQKIERSYSANPNL